MKFRKKPKPVVIEAIQFTGKNGVEIQQWSFNHVQYNLRGGLEIRTLEGNMIADPNDWIIKGIKGEFYPIKNDIFLETYEKVEE
jgi:hypothetical protein